MPKFKMNEPREGFNMFGYIASNGVIEVPETDLRVVAKLRGNSHFSEIKNQSRDEVIAALRARGIEFDGRSALPGLLRLLNESS